MLILGRRPGESILIDGGIRVHVTETGEPGWNAVFALCSLAYAHA